MENLKGTTTIGINCPDGVVLAADVRASMGHLAMHRAEKVQKISDFIGLATAGTVSDIQIITRWLRTQIDLYRLNKDEEPSVDIAANLLSSVLFSGARGFFPHIMMALLGGKSDGAWKLYAIYPDGTSIVDKYVAHGSGMELALGVLEENYKEGTKVEQAIKLARDAMTVAIRRDLGTGEAIEIFVVDDKGFRRVQQIEAKAVLR